MAALKTILFTVIVVIGVVTVGVPYLLLRGTAIEPGNFRWIGLPIIATGAIIYFWCAWNFTFHGHGTPAPFDPPKEMVATGLYRIMRNPMYVGVVSVLAGESLVFESLRLFVYTALIALGFHLRVIYYEEPTLSKKFGQSYERYCKMVPRWMPSAKRLA